MRLSQQFPMYTLPTRSICYHNAVQFWSISGVFWLTSARNSCPSNLLTRCIWCFRPRQEEAKGQNCSREMRSSSPIARFATFITWSNGAPVRFVCFATQRCQHTPYKETVVGDTNRALRTQNSVPPWYFNIFSIYFSYKCWLQKHQKIPVTQFYASQGGKIHWNISVFHMYTHQQSFFI